MATKERLPGSGTAEVDTPAICEVSVAIISVGPADVAKRLTPPWLLNALSISV